MKYVSTRGGSECSFSEAVASGLAPGGGLFVPKDLPDLSAIWPKWEGLGYAELAFEFLRLFIDDIPESELRSIINASYKNFSRPEVAPLKNLDANTYVLELFHGPTLAFKDFALQFLGNLYERQYRNTGRPINVLGATSGDTGAAAIHGLVDKPGIKIFILYPDGRISPLQERQIACTGAPNVYALAVSGTFDDAQAAVKAILADKVFSARHGLAAINSINIARLLAQSVYYLYAWLQFDQAKRERIEFVVPTGNFGNVLAGWLLTRMGVPIQSFKVATNRNDILYRFFKKGVYRVGIVKPTLAPSMDIQVASNFERFIYYYEDQDPVRVSEIMKQISKPKGTRQYTFRRFSAGNISVSKAEDESIHEIIGRVWRKYSYVIDPHTACAFKELSPDKISIVLATADPAKFPETIRMAIKDASKVPQAKSLEALKLRQPHKFPLKAETGVIKRFVAEHVADSSPLVAAI